MLLNLSPTIPSAPPTPPAAPPATAIATATATAAAAASVYVRRKGACTLCSFQPRIARSSAWRMLRLLPLAIGSMVVPFCGWYLGSYRVIPKRNYYGAYG